MIEASLYPASLALFFLKIILVKGLVRFLPTPAYLEGSLAFKTPLTKGLTLPTSLKFGLQWDYSKSRFMQFCRLDSKPAEVSLEIPPVLLMGP